LVAYRVLSADPQADALFTFNADDDLEALSRMVRLTGQVDCELWCGGRLVATACAGELPVTLGARSADDEYAHDA